jgi:acetyl esterase/lipase
VTPGIRWARANAGSLVGIAPKRIATVGYSAGGHLALFAAGAADTELAACVAFYPETELKDNSQALLPPGSGANRNFYGLADVMIPPESSERLLQAVRGAGVPSELYIFAGVPHTFDTHPEFADACAALIVFSGPATLHPRTYPPFAPGNGGGRGSER